MGNHLLCVKSDLDASVKTKNHPITESVSIASSICDFPGNSRIFDCISINNGITGKFISQRLVSVAAEFWITHIETLSAADKLELGCAILFAAISSNKTQMNTIIKYTLSKNIKIKSQGLKLLVMIQYLIRNLLRNDIDLHQTLQKLGTMHQQIGLEMAHFNIIIPAVHEAMMHYYPKQYNVDVQYAMEQIITISSNIMMHTEMPLHNTRSRGFYGKRTYFLRSLEICLTSDRGREYFYRYLENKYCPECVIYLQLMLRFRNEPLCIKERYTLAKELMNECIISDGEYAVNISYETRKNILDSFDALDKECCLYVNVPIDFFQSVEIEMRRLIVKNHWYKFVDSVSELRNSVTLDLCPNVQAQ